MITLSSTLVVDGVNLRRARATGWSQSYGTEYSTAVVWVSTLSNLELNNLVISDIMASGGIASLGAILTFDGRNSRVRVNNVNISNATLVSENSIGVIGGLFNAQSGGSELTALATREALTFVNVHISDVVVITSGSGAPVDGGLMYIWKDLHVSLTNVSISKLRVTALDGEVRGGLFHVGYGSSLTLSHVTISDVTVTSRQRLRGGVFSMSETSTLELAAATVVRCVSRSIDDVAYGGVAHVAGILLMRDGTLLKGNSASIGHTLSFDAGIASCIGIASNPAPL